MNQTRDRRTDAFEAARMLLHLGLAALPLLAISAQVFGLLSMRTVAALLIIPLVMTVCVVSVFAPRASDRIVWRGLLWGVFACVIYDLFRLDTVYILGWWGDFIPTMGTWVTGQPDFAGGAVVGYLWRYVGDGGGIGVTFFILAICVGLDRFRRRTVVLGAVAFAVFPVWAGLIATVALAPRGQSMMFPLTATTVTLSLIGHLIFGAVLGLGFWHSRDVHRHWPWPLLSVAIPVRIPQLLADVVVPTQGRHAMRRKVQLPDGVRPTTHDEWRRMAEVRSRQDQPYPPRPASAAGGGAVPPRPRQAPDHLPGWDHAPTVRIIEQQSVGSGTS